MTAILLLLSLATASISVTLSKAKVFLGLREWLSEVWPWAGELLRCPYCTSHWVALSLTLVFHPRPEFGLGVVGYLFLVWFSTVTLSAVWAGLILWAYRARPEAE